MTGQGRDKEYPKHANAAVLESSAVTVEFLHVERVLQHKRPARTTQHLHALEA